MSAYRADMYREEVKRLLSLAPSMKDAKSKRMLLSLAIEYHKMATTAEATRGEEQGSSSSGSWLSH